MYIVKKRNSSNLFDEMTNLFNDAFSGRTKLMKTDIVEHDDAYLFSIEMPGVDKKDVSLSLEDGYLVIKYEYTEKNDDESKYIKRERYFQSASRSYYVGDIKEKSIKAKLENGILSVYVPKEQKEVENKKCISIE